MMLSSLTRLSVQKGRVKSRLSTWGGMQSPCRRTGGRGRGRVGAQEEQGWGSRKARRKEGERARQGAKEVRRAGWQLPPLVSV